MKKLKYLVVFAIIFMMFTSVAFARAGGGGGGGSSSGGGGSSTSQAANPIASAVVMLSMNLLILSIYKTNNIICSVRVIKNHKEKKGILKALEEQDSKWALEKINKDVGEAFYIIQDAWTNMDQDIAIDYSTENLYKLHKSKLEWMMIRGERNILKKPKLLSIKVIGIDKSTNTIWVYIKGSMVDYIKKDGEVTQGNKLISMPFTEYWKFDYKGERWLLDEIKQSGDLVELDEISKNVL